MMQIQGFLWVKRAKSAGKTQKGAGNKIPTGLLSTCTWLRLWRLVESEVRTWGVVWTKHIQLLQIKNQNYQLISATGVVENKHGQIVW